MVYAAIQYEAPDHFLTGIIESIDATDNAVKVDGWDLSLTIHKCNPINGTPEEFDRRFDALVLIALNALNSSITKDECIALVSDHPQVVEWVEEYENEEAASKRRVRAAIAEAGKIIILPQFEPALIEVAHEAKPETKLVVFPSVTDGFMVFSRSPQSRKASRGVCLCRRLGRISGTRNSPI
jgi:hypothetical protein